jgi:hypothetical protein
MTVEKLIAALEAADAVICGIVPSPATAPIAENPADSAFA